METCITRSGLRPDLFTPLVAALALTIGVAHAEPSSADIAQMMEAMQTRLSALEARNAELEKRLEGTRGESAFKTRVEELENEVVALRDKPNAFPRLEGISAGASLVMVAQDADNAASELNVRADVEVELPMGSIGEAEGKLFAHLRAGDGGGVGNGAFATSNSTAFTDPLGNNIPQPVLMQAGYQLDMPVGADSGNLGRLEFTLGKIDPFGFFDGNNVADDETEQFLNLAFIHNPLLDAGGDIGVGDHGASPGVRMAYVGDINGGNNVSASVGIFGAGSGSNYLDSFGKPMVIGQLEYAGKTFGGMAGAYRLYAWSNGRALKLNGVTEERHTGWGISLDQQVAEHVTLFSRIGASTQGEVAVDRAFTLGAQFDGGLWGRESDRIGLAAGWLEASNASGFTGAEKPVELYYAWQVNDQIQLSPNVQWIQQPNGDTTAGDVTVWGLRAKASY